MSKIKVNSLEGVGASTPAITIDNASGTCSAKLTDNGGVQFANRNKIINGEFMVNQRNHSGSASHNSYTLDRWKYARSANSEFSTSQSTDTPDGFANSVKLDCISANGSTGANDYAYFRYHIEGQDLQELNKGTSAAKVATLSFYVKCDITGTFAINVVDANSRMCNLTYTVSNTNWNRYTVTIPADTSGAIANTNVTGLSVHFYIIAGSNITSGGSLNSWGAYDSGHLAQGHTANIVSTDHNWYMTGVQLEISDYATPFEHRTFSQELELCSRYYRRYTNTQSGNTYFSQGNVDNNGNDCQMMIFFDRPFRTQISSLETSGSAGDYAVRRDTTKTLDAVPVMYSATNYSCFLKFQSNSHGWSTGQAVLGIFKNTNAFLGFSAEL